MLREVTDFFFRVFGLGLGGRVGWGQFVRQAAMSTVLEIIDGGTRYLEKRGVEDARRNMQLLVAGRLGCTRMELYTCFDRPLGEAELVPLREDLRRRGEGVPLQHLLGKVLFHGREFRCDGRALIPRPETEELAERVLACFGAGDAEVLDMGCGSGVLGLTLAAERPDWTVTLADCSAAALALAGENAAALGISNVCWAESDLFAGVAGDFDGMVANLPYVAEGEREGMARELRHDPELALFGGADGLEVIRRFVPEARRRLRPGGWLALEIGHDQSAAVAGLLEAAGFGEIRVEKDLSGVERFPLARVPAGG